MADKEEDVQLGAAKFSERVPLGTGPQHEKDYKEAPPTPLFDGAELTSWSLWRAAIAEFVATLLFLYITINTVIGHKHSEAVTPGSGAGIKGIAWAFGGTIFVLVYSTAGISGALQVYVKPCLPTLRRIHCWRLIVAGGADHALFLLRRCAVRVGGHINPAVTFGLFLARKVSLPRFVIYVVAQSLGAIAGAGIVKGWQTGFYERYDGGANSVNSEAHYTKGTALGAEIVGTFVLVYTVFSATDAKRNARDSHVPVSTTNNQAYCLLAC